MTSKPLSVQCMIAALALCCILITGAICTILAVMSGDRALDTTKDSNTEGLRKTNDQCTTALDDTRAADKIAIDESFDAATKSIGERTDEMLLGLSALAGTSIAQTLDIYTMMAARYHDVAMGTKPIEHTGTYQFAVEMAPWMLADTKRFRNFGLTAMSMWMSDTSMVTSYEDYPTVSNPPDGYHHTLLGFADGSPRGYLKAGTAMPDATLNTTFDPVWNIRLPDGRLEHPDCRPFEKSPLTGKECAPYAMPGCRNDWPLRTDGAIDEGACYVGILPRTESLYQLAYAFFPADEARWIPILPLGSFIGIAVGMPWKHPVTGKKLGFVMSAMDMGSLTKFIQTIQVGGPGARSRIMLTAADYNWLYSMIPIPTFDDVGYMIAVTHGNSSTPIGSAAEGWAQAKRLAIDADDPLIRATARHLETNVNGSFAAVEDKVLQFKVNSTLTSAWMELLPGPVDPSGKSWWLGPEMSWTRWLNGRSGNETGVAEADPLPGFAKDGEDFFLTVKKVTTFPLKRGNTNEVGQKSIYVTLIIDREYVLGATDRLQAATKQNIEANNQRIAEKVNNGRAQVARELEISEQEVQDSLDQDRLILYIVVAATAILLMILSIITTMKIVKPIRALERDMALVAVMKLEGTEDQDMSAFDEVSKMQVSFLTMIKNLKEFRSYMPASVLLDDEEEEEEEVESETGTSKVAGSDAESGKGTASKRDSVVEGSRRSTQPSKISKSAQSKASMAVQKASAAMQLGVAKKAVAFVITNVRGFCEYFKQMDGVMDVHAQYLTRLLEEVKLAKGLPDGFNADRFFASFNGAKNTPSAKAAAGRCALACSLKALELLVPREGAIVGRVSVAATAGEGMCGNMGVDGMKKYCLIGLAQSYAHTLERHNAHMGTTVLMDQKVKADTEQSHRIRQMIPIFYKGATQRAWELVEAVKASEDEWMYQLEEAAHGDPGKRITDAIEMCIKNDPEQIKEALVKVREDTTQTPQHEIVAIWMEGKLASQGVSPAARPQT
eukprot:Hpha_TRINITY_DN15240_c5_g1::TRINITY_DN15240_c5_g1_i1::g.66162::m.66162